MWCTNKNNEKDTNQAEESSASIILFNQVQRIEFKLKLAKIFSANYHVEIDHGLIQVTAKNKHWKKRSKLNLTDIDLSFDDLVEFLLHRINTTKDDNQDELCKLSLALIKHRWVKNNKPFLLTPAFSMNRSMTNDLAKALVLLSNSHDDSIAKLANKITQRLLIINDSTTECTNPEWQDVIQQINENIAAIKAAIENLEANNAYKAIQDIANSLSVTIAELESVNILIAHNSKVDPSSAEEIIRVFSIIQNIIFSETL